VGFELLRNGLYNVAGQVVRGAVGLLTLPFLIRFLGIREYGVWSLACAVLVLMTMSEAGISVAAAVFLSRDLAQRDDRQASRTLTFVLISGLVLSGILGLFLWFAGPLIVRSLTALGAAERVDSARALQVASFVVSLLVLQRTLVGVEQAFQRYATINLLDLSQSLLTSIGFVLVAWMGGRTVALMKWQVTAGAILLVAHLCVVYRLLRGRGLRFEWSLEKARQIFPYSIATWAATLGTAAFGQCDRLIVGGILGAPLLGIYAAITDITSRINSFSGAAVQPLVPALSRDLTRNDPQEGRIRQAAHLNALIAIEAGVLLYVMADVVVGIMIPAASAPLDILGLQIAAIIYAFYSLNAPGYYILYSLGWARTNALVVLSSSVASLGLIFLGARQFGLLGALVGNAGYLGTLVLIVIGLRRAGVGLRRYLAWMAVPSLWLVGALIVGMALQEHLRLRAAFVAIQAALFVLWFSYEHGKARRMEFGLSSGS